MTDGWADATMNGVHPALLPCCRDMVVDVVVVLIRLPNSSLYCISHSQRHLYFPNVPP